MIFFFFSGTGWFLRRDGGRKRTFNRARVRLLPGFLELNVRSSAQVVGNLLGGGTTSRRCDSPKRVAWGFPVVSDLEIRGLPNMAFSFRGPLAPLVATFSESLSSKRF